MKKFIDMSKHAVMRRRAEKALVVEPTNKLAADILDLLKEIEATERFHAMEKSYDEQFAKSRDRDW